MEYHVGVIGLGYVGLPLAVEIGKHYPTIGFDINIDRIDELARNFDRTGEVESKDLKSSNLLSFTSSKVDLAPANIYIITVPTPIDRNKKPDLGPLISATRTAASMINNGDILIYESTVYPGTTEEICVPILEEISGLKYNHDFFCGYSPERINPGDKIHRLTTIKKVTSGSTPEIANLIDDFYKSFITAGTFKAKSIKVAEAAKVIENSQRDINIAFVNELALIFEKLDIDTKSVLEAASTKWNFLNFYPGLVGGHCIGVDPYYLTYKAEEVGYKPQIILSGRKVNDDMGYYIAQKIVKLLASKELLRHSTKVLILGFTFKENCPDVRNTRVIDILIELQNFNLSVDVHDPKANKDEVRNEYGLDLIDNIEWENYSAVVTAVAHDEYLGFDWDYIKTKVPAIYDVKGFLPENNISSRL